MNAVGVNMINMDDCFATRDNKPPDMRQPQEGGARNEEHRGFFCTLPSLDEILDQVAEEKPQIFSVLDLRAGYYLSLIHI